jgi:hypothetical protein
MAARPTPVPTYEAVRAADSKLGDANEAVEILRNQIVGWQRDRDADPPRLTPGQAWALHYFADGVRLDGQQLVGWANEISDAIDGLAYDGASFGVADSYADLPPRS